MKSSSSYQCLFYVLTWLLGSFVKGRENVTREEGDMLRSELNYDGWNYYTVEKYFMGILYIKVGIVVAYHLIKFRADIVVN